VMAALDLREVARRREQIAFMDSRRPDLYDQEPRVIGS